MTKNTEALLDLSKLISPTEIDNKVSKEIVLSKNTPWNEIIDFANVHLLIPTLYSALKHKGLLEHIEDKMIVEYLTTVYGYNRIRNEAIMIQLQDISNLLSEIGITPVLLKGAAALSEGYYHSIGARVMSDVDILVPEDEILKCIELLESKGGYKAVNSEHPLWDIHQYRKIYTENGVATLEFHFKSLAAAYPYFTNEELMKHVRPSKTIENAYIMEPSFDLYHVFLHSEISDHSHDNRALSLRQVHHAATIITACPEEFDWDLPAKEIKKHELSTVWGDYLYMLNELFGVKSPPEMMGSSEHFHKTIHYIGTEKTKKSTTQLFWKHLKNALSYQNLKKRYDLTSKLEYPLAFIKSLFRIVSKYAFSSESRKALLEYFKKLMKLKRYGGHH